MSNMKCTKKFTNKGLTKWYQVYLILLDNGPMSKKEILDYIWPSRNSYFCNVVDRGYCSAMFAAMHSRGIILYNKATRKWEVGTINN